MEQSEDLETRFCVVWKAKLPDYGGSTESSQFPFLGYQWTLKLDKIVTNWNYLQCKLNIFKNVFHTGIDDRYNRREFHITTFLENERNGTFSHICSVKSVKETPTTLLHFRYTEDLYYREFFYNNELKIICLFHGVSLSEIQSTTERVQLSTRNNLDLPAALDLMPDLENLSLDFSNLLKDNAFADVKLRCGDGTVSAHRAILAARSEVFAAMFRNKMVESETGVVDVPDLDAQVLEIFLSYVYTGKIQGLSDDTVPSLYAAGDKYAVHALKSACSDRMIRSLNEENCVGFLSLADAHSDFAFKDKVVSFICNHEAVLQSQVWITFSERQLKLANEVYQSYVRSKSRGRFVESSPLAHVPSDRSSSYRQLKRMLNNRQPNCYK